MLMRIAYVKIQKDRQHKHNFSIREKGETKFTVTSIGSNYHITLCYKVSNGYFYYVPVMNSTHYDNAIKWTHKLYFLDDE